MQVGDKVLVRADLEVGKCYGNDTFVDRMNRFRGKWVTIKEIVYGDKFHIAEDESVYAWTEEMFVMGISQIEPETESESEVADFPTISVPERDDTEYVERAVRLSEELYDTYSCSESDDVPYPYKDEYVRKGTKNHNNAKKHLNDLFSRHPLWDNRTHSIVFEADLLRAINREDVVEFRDWVMKQLYDRIPELRVGKFTYKEIRDAIQNLERINAAFDYIPSVWKENQTICGYTHKELCREIYIWKDRKCLLREQRPVEIQEPNAGFFSEESKVVSEVEDKKYNAMRLLFNALLNNLEQFVNEEFAKACKDFEDQTNIRINGVVGKKVSKVIGAACRGMHLDEIVVKRTTVSGREYDDGYNRRYMKFTDAVNPLTFKQKTVITTDIVAFLTCSFGHNWASCYTIDKRNKRCIDSNHNYHGCYSGGTTSYGNDETTFVLYTVNNGYDGDEPVMEEKLNRCFFSLGEGKLIQSRNYPDGRDGGDESLAAQFRAIVQKVVADCYDIPNRWTIKRGTEECSRVINYEGAGYHDHVEYDDCNVSYWKGMDGNALKNEEYVTIGADTICPSCGEWTDYEEAVVCYDCQENAVRKHTYCAECGRELDLEYDDYHEINGEYYCDDCCFYCAYHDRYEPGEEYEYIEDYGAVCEDALYYGDFHQDPVTDEWFYDDNGGDAVYIEYNGQWYACEENANDDGFVRCRDGEWRPEDEAWLCPVCEEMVGDDEWDNDAGCCTDCAEDNESSVA